MGNRETTLKFEQVLADPARLCATKVASRRRIRVPLDPPALGTCGMTLDYIVVQLAPSSLELFIGSGRDEAPSDYECDFDTHMRDFEVLQEGDGPKIARGQGIGVIVDEATRSYVKLVYDGKSENGVVPASFQRWDGTSLHRTVLSHDLGLGYHVYIIDLDGKLHSFVEPRDKSDARKTMVLFKSLAPLAKYTREASSDDDNDGGGGGGGDDDDDDDDESSDVDQSSRDDDRSSSSDKDPAEEQAEVSNKRQKRASLPPCRDPERADLARQIYGTASVGKSAAAATTAEPPSSREA